MLLSAFKVPNSGNENAIKAMFIYNFSKYFDWTQVNENSDFTIAVYGTTEVTNYLKEITKKKFIQGKSVYVKKASSLSELSDVQMLFIAGHNSQFIHAINNSVYSGSLIIITENPGNHKFLSHINLIRVHDKLGFELNETRLKDNNIKFSKELSGLASKFY